MKNRQRKTPKMMPKLKFWPSSYTTREKRSSFRNSNKTKKNKIKSKVIKK